jgi:aquaporin Z
MMKKYVVELIGTFFLMLGIIMIVFGGVDKNVAPLGIGALLIGVIYGGGHLSNAHYNPAVTLSLFLRGRMDKKDIPGYIISQVLGVVLAATAADWMLPEVAVSAIKHDVVPSLLAEFLGTFLLIFVILNIGTAKNNLGNPLAGIAISCTVVAGVYAFGGISGAVFNPAVAVGFGIVGLSAWADIWIYMLANFAASVAATYTFLFVNGSE